MNESFILKVSGLIAIVLAAAMLSPFLSDNQPDLWSALNAKYAAGTRPFITFVSAGALAVNVFVLGVLALITATRNLSLKKIQTRWGLFWMWVGANCLAFGFVAGNLISKPGRNDAFVEWSDAPVFLAYAMVGVGIVFMRKGWKYDVTGAGDFIASDPRPPVIYLRSFQDDVKSPVRGWYGILMKPLTWFLPVSFEQDLAAIMNRLGPFVAIGKPGERVPELGAARFYVTDSEWQQRVSELIRKARLTVILSGTTSSLWWEIDHVMASVPPRQVVLISVERGKQTRAFEEKLEQKLGCPGALLDKEEKPSLLSKLVFGPRVQAGKVIYFTDDWKPLASPIQSPRKFKDTLKIFLRPYSVYGQPLEAAFEIVFSRLGLPWKYAGPNRAMAIVLATCFGFFGLHLFYLGDKPRGKKYLAFCWTFVPVFLGFRDAVKLVLMERTQFETTYGSRQNDKL